MFGPQDFKDYINAQAASGYRNPLVPVADLPRRLADATQRQFLSYSIIPVSVTGGLAADGTATAYVAMPHVFARTREGCGQWNTVKAKAARLTSKGFANDPDPASSAEEILARIITVYGLPGGVAMALPVPSGSPERAPITPLARPSLTQKGLTEASVRERTAQPEGSAERAPVELNPGTNPEDAFEILRRGVAEAYSRSDILVRQKALGENWSYAVCGLPLRPGSPLLLGLNWGVNRQVRHDAQAAPPGPGAYNEVASYPFIARSRTLLERHLGRIQDLNYLNVVPFRTPDLTFLAARDWDLGIHGFFLDAIDYLRPPITLILGTTAVPELALRMGVEYRTVSVAGGSKMVNGYLGRIQSRAAQHRFVAVPHPNNRLTATAREAIWTAVFRDLEDLP